MKGGAGAPSNEFAEASVDPRDAVLVSKRGINPAAAASTLMSTPLVIEKEDN